MSALLTVRECAARLGMSQSWVRRHVRSLPAVRVGSRVRFDPAAVEKFCTNHSSQFIVPAETENPLKQGKEWNMLQRNRYQRGSVTLYKGKRMKVWYGVWREDVIGHDGVLKRRQRNVRLGTLDEVPTKAAARERLRLSMGSPQQPRAEMTFSELVTMFETLHVPTMKASTGRYRLRMLKSKSLRDFSPVPISRLTRADVEAMVIRESKRYSESVVRGLLSSLSQLLAYACDHGFLAKNPADRIKLPRHCAGKRVQRHVCTRGQVGTMVRGLAEPYASFVLLLATTGLRVGEALALKQLDLADGVLQVRRRLSDGEIDTVKTRHSERALPLPESLVTRLRGLSKTGWIFQARNGEPLNPKNVMRRYVLPAAKAAGLTGINWHSFRHSFTVEQRRQGTHPKVLSELLGHASVATHMDAYDHASESELRQPLDQLLRDVMKMELVV